ncbi:MAG: polysaccharide biosynthesis/export family protein [Verrucomicrobia bacterium]|nr:polysaccharide biosynthesis/export family protein [Verrucomicrobiota bacterium]
MRAPWRPPTLPGRRLRLALCLLPLLAGLFLAGVCPRAGAQTATNAPTISHEPAGSGVFNLRVVSQSPDNSEVTLAMDYSYNGLWGPTARVLPVVEKTAQKDASLWFGSDGAVVKQGQGTITTRVKYFFDERQAPPEITTDTISVWMLSGDGHAVVAVTPFSQSITWAHPQFRLASRQVPPANPLPATAMSNTPPDSATAAGSFAVDSPTQRAPWQQHLTLGPGDVLDLALFGEPDLSRSDVAVGPDGRVSYLEAQDILASGLTIDQLRSRLDEELAKYRRTPRTIVTPVLFRSKKYYMLGQVSSNGVFTLDRPLTIVEAVARARGLETGFSGHNLVELADLSRTFLERHGRRMPVDFEKLFLQGDLSQNIPLAPDDYLYFPPTALREIYLLGEVKLPGPVPYTEDLSAVRAIADRGGFTDRAWKSRILVIRGSLNHPESFVVNVAAVLAARQSDFRLQPKDIVYVNARPWIKAEELLDAATSAFAASAVIFWTGAHVPLMR